MAPPKNKRAPSQEDEVCKRLKEEIKSTQATDQPAGKDDIVEKSHNNNNNDTKNGTSKKEAGDAVETAEQQSKLETAQTKEEEAKSDDAKVKGEVNGANEVKVDKSELKDEAEDQTKSETNGKKTEEAQTKSNTGSSSTNSGSTKTTAAAAETAKTATETPEPEEEPSGTLIICGGANWDMTGRKELPKAAKKPVEVNPAARNLWGPNRVVLEGSDKDLRVRGVFSGCNACHSVVVTDDGTVLTFGRNDKGQLGLGDTETRFTPVVVEALKDIDIVAAACGRSHTLFLASDGVVYSCGDNKMGQCGTNQMAVQQILTPCRIAFKENKPVVKIACGAEFSMIVDIEGKLYSFGHPEHGQLGHNSEGKYFTSGNKYAFHCEYAPRRIVTFIEKSREGHVSPVDNVSITDIACGTNHTLAVDSKNRCFSWGFAGYHRLGHCEVKNELVPRSIKVFDAPNNSGRGATRVFAGATHSMALDVNGLLYFWGQNKSSGEATMYPKNVQDLCGWRIKAVSCANRSIFVVADDICISWGPSPTYGELGYGEGKSKSSTIPQEVKTLDGVHVMSVACGFGHTLLIARDSSPDDQASLKKLRSWPA